jgi:2'-5' RNA ligase
MSGIRSFIAVPLDRQLLQQIANISQMLKESVRGGVSWVQPASIHLTLKFLGDIQPGKIAKIKKILQTVVPKFNQFELNAAGLGCFPNKNKPRVVWVGLHAPAELCQLQKTIEDACADMGFEREQRKFSPHLTLGRVKPYARDDDILCLQQVLENIPSLNLGATHAREVILFKSDLQSTGAVYTPLISVQLKEK